MWKALDPSTGQGGPQGIYGNGDHAQWVFTCLAPSLTMSFGSRRSLKPSPEGTSGKGRGAL